MFPLIVNELAAAILNVPVPLKVKLLTVGVAVMFSVFVPGTLMITLSVLNGPPVMFGVQLVAVV
jgi:hypothetical protein